MVGGGPHRAGHDVLLLTVSTTSELARPFRTKGSFEPLSRRIVSGLAATWGLATANGSRTVVWAVLQDRPSRP